LTPSARSGNLIAGDGTKNGLSRSEQKTDSNLKQPLDRKSPIQVCEFSVPERRTDGHENRASAAKRDQSEFARIVTASGA